MISKRFTIIAKWYKPVNKRQVWLHTMFKLRRQMLALEIYAKAEDGEALKKWAMMLAGDYGKIAEMVPQWEKRLDSAALAAIETAATENRYADVLSALTELGKSCQSCHDDFRAVTATLYRAPDFSGLKISGSVAMAEHMKSLSQQINRIKIGFVDGKETAALSAFQKLETEMDGLGTVCVSCHKKPEKAYPTPAMTLAMASLKQSLKTGSLKDKGQALGSLAVMACATCHGTHRLSGDTQALFKQQKSMGALLDHSY